MLDLESKEILKLIKAYFPQCFDKNGKLITQRLKESIADFIARLELQKEFETQGELKAQNALEAQKSQSTQEKAQIHSQNLNAQFEIQASQNSQDKFAKENQNSQDDLQAKPEFNSQENSQAKPEFKEQERLEFNTQEKPKIKTSQNTQDNSKAKLEIQAKLTQEKNIKESLSKESYALTWLLRKAYAKASYKYPYHSRLCPQQISTKCTF
ncbi:hypothetical protein [Campylobacter troglodytis]|uniref:hypothetical protein n=1 Tax=Campylobacter troglodytis TaxID=654363 RepID=UPI00115A6DCF|nr:hypothetical protein [Campylobacter troglodytis]TQR59633.1 hypothetical protein DMC01_06890 [Campylobacter troglodytis]